MIDISDQIATLTADRDDAIREARRCMRSNDAIVAAMPDRFLLDLPDGGDVKLHEGVARMARAVVDLTAERDTARADLAAALKREEELRDALVDIIQSWDGRTDEREVFKPADVNGPDRWSPVASMVASHAIARARSALAPKGE